MYSAYPQQQQQQQQHQQQQQQPSPSQYQHPYQHYQQQPQQHHQYYQHAQHHLRSTDANQYRTGGKSNESIEAIEHLRSLMDAVLKHDDASGIVRSGNSPMQKTITVLKMETPDGAYDFRISGISENTKKDVVSAITVSVGSSYIIGIVYSKDDPTTVSIRIAVNAFGENVRKMASDMYRKMKKSGDLDSDDTESDSEYISGSSEEYDERSDIDQNTAFTKTTAKIARRADRERKRAKIARYAFFCSLLIVFLIFAFNYVPAFKGAVYGNV